jgi:hypothetical protein
MRVLCVSGYTEDAGTGLNFLPKPYSAGQLARKVREVLGATDSLG